MEDYHHTLPSGAELPGPYRIESVLGTGGFGNTYLAMDLNLKRKVAIKEYYPADLAVRSGTTKVHPKTKSSSDEFAWGLARFSEEARTLAKFRHPNIVKVFNTFTSNGTAYMVLEFVEGWSLDEWLKEVGHIPNQTELDELVSPLLDALEEVHGAGILHRDIKPANIYIRKEDMSPVLLDFGAARYAAKERAGTTHAIVSRGYSPQEAYASDARMQGPWTDIYGLAATVYAILTGDPPFEATRRTIDDTLTPATALPIASSYRLSFLAAIDYGLRVRPNDRPQSIAEWREYIAIESGGFVPPTIPANQVEPISKTPTARPSTVVPTRGSTTRRGAVPKTRKRTATNGLLVAGVSLLVAALGYVASETLFSTPDNRQIAGNAGFPADFNTAPRSGQPTPTSFDQSEIRRRRAAEEQARAQAQAERDRRAREAAAARQRRLDEERAANERLAEQQRLAEQKRLEKQAEEQRALEAEKKRLAELRREEERRQKEADEADRLRRIAEERSFQERLQKEREAAARRQAQLQREAAAAREAEERRRVQAEAERQRQANLARQRELERQAQIRREAQERERLAEQKRREEERQRRLAAERDNAERLALLQRQRTEAVAREQEDQRRREAVERERRAAAERKRLADEAKRRAEEQERVRLASLPSDQEFTENVRTIQEKLKQMACLSGQVDGDFGSGTERAVARIHANASSTHIEKPKLLRKASISKVTVGEFQSWTKWLDSLQSFRCPAPRRAKPRISSLPAPSRQRIKPTPKPSRPKPSISRPKPKPASKPKPSRNQRYVQPRSRPPQRQVRARQPAPRRSSVFDATR